jgi:hypothetical protein
MSPMSESDWRLSGQEKYLTGVSLVHRRWSQTQPNWNHDHCAFCWTTFAVYEGADVLHEGWTTPDEYHWICDQCFNDFRERFDWIVVLD